MTIITGCTILRDAKGNPGEMILHRREATQEEMDAMCRKLMAVAAKLKGGASVPDTMQGIARIEPA